MIAAVARGDVKYAGLLTECNRVGMLNWNLADCFSRLVENNDPLVETIAHEHVTVFAHRNTMNGSVTVQAAVGRVSLLPGDGDVTLVECKEDLGSTCLHIDFPDLAISPETFQVDLTDRSIDGSRGINAT